MTEFRLGPFSLSRLGTSSQARLGLATLLAILLVLDLIALSSTERVKTKNKSASEGISKQATGTVEAGPGGESAVTTTAGAPTSASGRRARGRGGAGGAGEVPGFIGPSKGRGFNENEILLGIATNKSHQKDAAALGISVDPIDSEAIIRTFVKDLNRRGGILGRTVVPVMHEVSPADSPQGYAVEQEKACAAWTQDRQVFSAITLSGYINDEVLFACMAKRDTPVLMSDNNFHSDAVLNRYDSHLYMPNVISIERQVPIWLDRLEALNYFSPWNTTFGAPGTAPVKVGLLYATARNEYVRWGEKVKSELARRGWKGDKFEEFVLTGNSNSEDVQQLGSAILRFKRLEVTHVLAFVTVPSSTTAEAQRYRPRWGVSTYTNPYITQLSENVPDQLNGALGVGNMPRADLDPAHQPPDSEEQKRCKKLVQESGHSLANSFAVGAMYQYCDSGNTLRDALNASKEISTAGLRRGIDSLGRVSTTYGLQASFGPRRHGSGAAVRDLGYDRSCPCFVYLSGTEYPVP